MKLNNLFQYSNSPEKIIVDICNINSNLLNPQPKNETFKGIKRKKIRCTHCIKRFLTDKYRIKHEEIKHK